jgi:redox-sensing transcriptional repressor
MDDLPAVIARTGIMMAIMAVPARGAQEAADALVAAGIGAILNYAPITIQVPSHVRIRHIDPIVALQSMTYYLDTEQAAEYNGTTHDKVRLGKHD